MTIIWWFPLVLFENYILYLESTFYKHLEDGRSSKASSENSAFLFASADMVLAQSLSEPLGTELENPMFSCPEAKRAGSSELVGSILFYENMIYSRR